MTSIRVVKFKKVWWHNCLPRWREVRKREVRCALLDERSHRRGRGRSKSSQQIRNSAWRSLIVQKIIFARLFLYLKSLKTPTQSVEELNVLKKNVVGGRRVEKIKKNCFFLILELTLQISDFSFLISSSNVREVWWYYWPKSEVSAKTTNNWMNKREIFNSFLDGHSALGREIVLNSRMTLLVS